LLTDRREAFAKCRPVYFARTKLIPGRNYSADGLFYQRKKSKIFKISFPLRLPFSCLRNLKLFRDIKGSNFT